MSYRPRATPGRRKLLLPLQPQQLCENKRAVAAERWSAYPRSAATALCFFSKWLWLQRGALFFKNITFAYKILLKIIENHRKPLKIIQNKILPYELG